MDGTEQPGDAPTFSEVCRLYDSMATSYDDVEAEPFYSNQYQAYARHLDRLLPDLAGHVLDVGCGTGLQSIRLAPRSASVTAFDISKGLLDKAAEKGRDRGNLRFLRADAVHMPFRDGAFDAAVSLGEVFSHIARYREAFAEIMRVVRPGGLVTFSVLNKWSLRALYSAREAASALGSLGGHHRLWSCEDDAGGPTRMHLRTFTRREVKRLGRDIGFRVLSSQGIHVTSLVVPLGLQRRKASLWSRVYRGLGTLDAVLAGSRPFCNLGYTCIYACRKA